MKCINNYKGRIRYLFLPLLIITVLIINGCLVNLPGDLDLEDDLIPGGTVVVNGADGESVRGTLIDTDNDGTPDGIDLDNDAGTLEFVILSKVGDGWSLDINGDDTADMYMTVWAYPGGFAVLNTESTGDGDVVTVVKDNEGTVTGIDKNGDGTSDVTLVPEIVTDNAVPTASSVTISGTETVGSVLTGSYTYNDAESDAEGTSTFRWLRYDNAACTSGETLVGTSSTYTLTVAETGKWLKFEVTPVAAGGESPGTAVRSSATGQISDPDAPVPGNSGTITTDNIASSSLTLNWTAATDSATAQNLLQYLVYYYTSDTIDTVADMEDHGTAFGSYTVNIATKDVTGLSSSTTYYFNLIVKDGEGKKTAYQTVSETTAVSPDVTAPSVSNGTITPSGETVSSVNLSWTKATDDTSAQSALQYLVYYYTSDTIDTVADMEDHGTAFGGYAADIAAKSVTGLSDGTPYYFNLIVKDEAGNKTPYTTASTTTTDGTAPTAGNSGTLTTSGVGETEITVNWTKATDNVSAQSALEYLVYYSESDNIDSVADMGSNGTSFGSFAADIATKTVTGLTSDTTYYFNLIVKDEAGNQTPYVTVSESTSGGTPSGYVVTGYDEAGLGTHGNGTYTQIADYNGKVAYQFDNSVLYTNEIFTIRWDTTNTRWEIYNASYSDWDYYHLSDTTTPPTSGWYKYGAEGSPDVNLTLTPQ